MGDSVTAALDVPFPSKGLRYPKTVELPPFQTFEEIQRQTRNLDPESDKSKELWASVFLDLDQIKSLLDQIRERANEEFVYPMAFAAAHTGARRSELIRVTRT